jgi:hypothetical protein
VRLLNNAGSKEDNAGTGVVRWPCCEAHSYCGTTSTYCRTPDFRPNTVERPRLLQDYGAMRPIVPMATTPTPRCCQWGPRLLQQRLEWSSGAIKQRAFRGGLGAWAPWDLGRALGSAVMVVGDPLCHQAPVPVSGGVTMGNASFGVVTFGPACEGPSQSSRLP